MSPFFRGWCFYFIALTIQTLNNIAARHIAPSSRLLQSTSKVDHACSVSDQTFQMNVWSHMRFTTKRPNRAWTPSRNERNRHEEANLGTLKSEFLELSAFRPVVSLLQRRMTVNIYGRSIGGDVSANPLVCFQWPIWAPNFPAVCVSIRVKLCYLMLFGIIFLVYPWYFQTRAVLPFS